MEEFYETLGTVSVSALTGEGIDDLFEAAQRCRADYMADYKPDLDRRRAVCPVAIHHVVARMAAIAPSMHAYCCRTGISWRLTGVQQS